MNKIKMERMEISSIHPTVKKKVRKYCIDKNITLGQFIEMGYLSLKNKEIVIHRD